MYFKQYKGRVSIYMQIVRLYMFRLYVVLEITDYGDHCAFAECQLSHDIFNAYINVLYTTIYKAF